MPASVGRPFLRERLPVDVLAGETHFLQHVIPVYLALPPELRGTVYVRSPAVAEMAARYGVEAKMFEPPFEGVNPIITAAYGDLERVVRYGDKKRALIFMEHGAGFAFGARNTSYAGGAGCREFVSLFLETNLYTKLRNHNAYPTTPQAVVGCAKMDRWFNEPKRELNRRDPVVALSFHWDCRVAPETRSAFPFYKNVLPALAREYKVIGHGHPRAMDNLIPQYEAMGIEVVRDFDEVMQRADVYVCDASSTIYEFAALDLPVVVLNCPLYRRGISYGLRFWQHANVGVNVNKAEDLNGAVAVALRDEDEQRKLRRKAVEAVYPVRGNSAKAASDAIVKHLQAPFDAKEIVCTTNDAGVLYVAIGDKARKAAAESIQSVRDMCKGLRIALVSDAPLPGVDIFIERKDDGSNARSYKTQMYSLSPFNYTLYLDADTIVTGPLKPGFNVLRKGWDVACAVDFRNTVRDIDHLTPADKQATQAEVGDDMLHYNTGVIYFRKSEANAALFAAWHAEWKRFKQMDQGAFVRAVHSTGSALWVFDERWNSHEDDKALHIRHYHHTIMGEE